MHGRPGGRLGSTGTGASAADTAADDMLALLEGHHAATRELGIEATPRRAAACALAELMLLAHRHGLDWVALEADARRQADVLEIFAGPIHRTEPRDSVQRATTHGKFR